LGSVSATRWSVRDLGEHQRALGSVSDFGSVGALGSISALVSVNILLIAGKACNKLPAFGRLKVYNA
jgi:hypothetical protein